MKPLRYSGQLQLWIEGVRLAKNIYRYSKESSSLGDKELTQLKELSLILTNTLATGAGRYGGRQFIPILKKSLKAIQKIELRLNRVISRSGYNQNKWKQVRTISRDLTSKIELQIALINDCNFTVTI